MITREAYPFISVGEFGLSTNRALTSDRSEGGKSGILCLLNLKWEDLVGRKILDVCIGGGNAVSQAIIEGLDYTGIDILPTLETGGNLSWRKKQLAEIAARFPGRIIAADAVISLPFKDNCFDLVISSMGMPLYAQNGKEAAWSILEMIRVSKGKVVFSGGWPDEGDEDPEGFVFIGGEDNLTAFPLKGLLDLVAKVGITYTRQAYEDMTSFWRSIHLDVSQKDMTSFLNLRQEILKES